MCPFVIEVSNKSSKSTNYEPSFGDLQPHLTLNVFNNPLAKATIVVNHN